MGNIFYNISQVLGISIIHSLWQGLIIYFLLKIVLMISNQLSAATKYIISLIALAFLSIWFGYTLISQIKFYNWHNTVPNKFSAIPMFLKFSDSLTEVTTQQLRYYYNIEKYLPIVTIIYLAGLAFNTLRLIVARKELKFIRKNIQFDDFLQSELNRLVKYLPITKTVKIGFSKLVNVPCITGYIKPIILLPFTLTTNLGHDEIEAIILHELAHIKRNDYLINIAQQLITTLLFFNPCALLIGQQINEERENCIDDLVVHATQSPIIYAKALLKLEQHRGNELQLALAATGKKYHLLNRIERIMETKKTTLSLRPTLLALLILSVGILFATILKPEIAHGKISIKSINQIIAGLQTDTPTTDTLKTRKDTLKIKNELRAKRLMEHKMDVDAELNDPDLQKLTNEVAKHGAAISLYYNSPAFKKLEAELQAKAKEMEEQFNTSNWKELEKKQEDLSKEFGDKWAESAETKKLEAQMEQLGKKIENYYKSSKFKNLNSQLQKKYGIDPNQNYSEDGSDEKYKKYHRELEQDIPAEVKEYAVDLKKLGEQMNAKFNTDEFHKKNEELKLLGDSIGKLFKSGMFKEQQLAMKKLNEDMRAYQNNGQMQKEQELLKRAQEKLQAYLNSPAFKNRIQKMKEDAKNWSESWDSDLQAPEPPKAPEKGLAPAPPAPPAQPAPVEPKSPPAPPAPGQNIW